MPDQVELITTLAWGLGLSLILGYLVSLIRMPALVGYLLAGVFIAPTTPGFVGNLDLASQLSEVGVILLMFGVGLHFSLKDLLQVRTVAVPGAILQMTATTAIGTAMAYWFWDWTLTGAFILGVALACASTVVMTKALDARGILQTVRGRLAVGWLVVQDLVTVLLLVLLPTIGTLSANESISLAQLSAQILGTATLVVGFIASMVIIGRRALPWILMRTVKTGSQELFTLCVIAIAITIAYASSTIFHVSFALGAFFAGMMMRESEYSHRAALQTLPLQDAFSVIFFLGIGMLFDPKVLLEHPFEIFFVVLLVIFVNSTVAGCWVRRKGYRLIDAATVGLAVSQVGEFSFILSGLAVSMGLAGREELSLIVAVGIITIALNSIFFAGLRPFFRRFFPELVQKADDEDSNDESETVRNRILIVGAGIAGRELFKKFESSNFDTYLIEKQAERSMRQELGEHFIFGDASHPLVLSKLNLDKTRWVLITTSEPLIARSIADQVAKIDSKVKVLALSDKEGDRDFFISKSGQLDASVTALIETRKEIADSIFERVQQDSRPQRKSGSGSKKR
jgi:CPA2 family monovalent cation:H+ antiporter-2